MGWSVVNLPNMLSWARLAAMPLTVWCILNNQLDTAFIIFVAAGVTDALDGFLARRLDLVSDFGRVIDPVADKALLVATYVALAYSGYLPMWLAILVVGRDIAIVKAVRWLPGSNRGVFLARSKAQVAKRPSHEGKECPGVTTRPLPN